MAEISFLLFLFSSFCQALSDNFQNCQEDCLSLSTGLTINDPGNKSLPNLLGLTIHIDMLGQTFVNFCKCINKLESGMMNLRFKCPSLSL